MKTTSAQNKILVSKPIPERVKKGANLLFSPPVIGCKNTQPKTRLIMKLKTEYAALNAASSYWFSSQFVFSSS